MGEESPFQRREWRVERFGWGLMAAIVVAGLFGMWGNGLLSQSQIASADGSLSVSYERFVRNLGQSELEVQVAPGSSRNGMLRLLVSQDFLAANQVEGMSPQPTIVRAQGGQWAFEFPASERARLTMRFDFRPSGGPGTRQATVSTTTGSVRFQQHVYP